MSHPEHKPFLGILSLDTTFPRIQGDVGNPSSYPLLPVWMWSTGLTVPKLYATAGPTRSWLQPSSTRHARWNGMAQSTGFDLRFLDQRAG